MMSESGIRTDDSRRADSSPGTGDAMTDALVAERSRLLPKFSFRMLFGLTLATAIVAAMARLAGAEQAGGAAALATGVVVAIGFLAALVAVLVSVFLMGWLAALMTHQTLPEGDTGDPDLPPQWVAPRDPVL